MKTNSHPDFDFRLRSTTLTSGFRSELLRCVMTKGFREKIKAHNDRVTALADKIYHKTFADILDIMDALPAGICNKSHHLPLTGDLSRKIWTNSGVARLHSNRLLLPSLSIPPGSKRYSDAGPAELISSSSWSLKLSKEFPFPARPRTSELDRELNAEIDKIMDLQVALVKEYEEARETATRIIAGCKTLSQLEEAWPEAYGLLPKDLVASPAKSTAIAVKAPTQLSTLLNLTSPQPVDVTANPTLQ